MFRILLEAECATSSLFSVGGRFESDSVVATLQKSWQNATDMERANIDLTKKANVVPMARLNCCFE